MARRGVPAPIWVLYACVAPDLSGPQLVRLFWEIQRLRASSASSGPTARLVLRRLERRFAAGVEHAAGSVEPGTAIGPDTIFNHGFHGVHISSQAVIGARCSIMHSVTIGLNPPGAWNNAPIIGDDVFIGAGANIIGRCNIGDGAKIGAGVTLVNATIAPGSVIINKSAYNLTEGKFVYSQN